MATKNVKTRIQNKHDYEYNWNQAENFIPLAGELIIYDADINAPTPATGTHSLPRIKIGDGVSLVGELDFIDEDLINIIQSEFDNSFSCGTADPSASTTSKFYFKYSK